MMWRSTVGMLVLVGTVCGMTGESHGAHCVGITDMQALAQCEASHTPATSAAGMIGSGIGSLPQYSGTAGCQTAGCSGATQEGYFSTNGDVSTLNNDGATAAATDPRMTELQTTRTNVQGWNLTTSPPLLTAEVVAGSVTAPPVTTGCTDVTVCNAWSAATPSTQSCTVPGSAISSCSITDNVTARTETWTSTAGFPIYVSGWRGPNDVNVNVSSLGSNQYVAQVQANCCWWYAGYVFTAAPVALAPDEIIVSTSLQVLMRVQGDGSAGCGSWLGWVPVGAVWRVLACTARGDQSGWARVEGVMATWQIRQDVVSDGCGGLRSSGWSQISSVCNDAAPRTVTTNTGVVLTLPPPSSFPLNVCWDRSEQWGYQGSGPDTCAALLNQNCSQTSSVCTSPLPGGCDTYTNTMSCPGGSVCTAETVIRQCSSCGTPDSLVPFCVDQTTPPNTNLANAATWLAMLDSIKNDWDPDNLRIFTGRRMSCDYDTLGSLIVNCCDTDPTALIGNCSDEEILLAQERRDRKSHYVGNRCVTTGPFGICLRREEVYCSYSSQLARMIHDQGQPQLGLSWGSANSPICDGFTVEQFTAINWSLIDFSEWYANVSASIDPVGITSTMTTRICAATGSC